MNGQMVEKDGNDKLSRNTERVISFESAGEDICLTKTGKNGSKLVEIDWFDSNKREDLEWVCPGAVCSSKHFRLASSISIHFQQNEKQKRNEIMAIKYGKGFFTFVSSPLPFLNFDDCVESKVRHGINKKKKLIG